MNKKRKKYSVLTRAFLLFSAVILALSFSACSGGTDADAEKTPTAAAATPTPQETAKPTEAPTEPPPENTVEITVEKYPSLFTIFGEATTLAENDAGVPYPCIKLEQSDEDLFNEEYYNSGVYITLNASEECSAVVYVTLAAPDAVNGASGYMLKYCMNEEFEDPDLDPDYVDLDMECLEPLQTVQEFVFDIDLRQGENKLYLFQSTAGEHGGWRISVTGLRLELSAGDIALPEVEEKPKNVIDFPAEGLVLDTTNYDTARGIRPEDTTDEKTQSGQNFGYFDVGAELTYVLNVQKAGTYEISYRLSSPDGTGVLEVYVDDEEAGAMENSENTGDYQAWIDLEDKTEIELSEGEHTLKFSVTESGFNISYFTVLPKA